MRRRADDGGHSDVIRWSGVAAVIAGVIFAGIQPIHPADELSAVTDTAWIIITTLKLAMCFLLLLGITGLYVRQVDQAGWLGLVGYVLFGLSWSLQSGFVFVEAFVLPVLATASPEFVNSYLGIVNGRPGQMNVGALPAIYQVLVGIPYTPGGVALGIATFRARVLPRRPACLLAIVAGLTPLAAMLPHRLQRLAAVPMGAHSGLAWVRALV
jgi:hypothetical protein